MFAYIEFSSNIQVLVCANAPLFCSRLLRLLEVVGKTSLPTPKEVASLFLTRLIMHDRGANFCAAVHVSWTFVDIPPQYMQRFFCQLTSPHQASKKYQVGQRIARLQLPPPRLSRRKWNRSTPVFFGKKKLRQQHWTRRLILTLMPLHLVKLPCCALPCAKYASRARQRGVDSVVSVTANERLLGQNIATRRVLLDMHNNCT